MKGRYRSGGFTLMEILIVVVIIGIIAGFGIPQYSTFVERGYRQDAETQLRLIHKAQQMYRVKYNEFYPPSSDNSDKSIVNINTALQLNINPNQFTYICSYGTGPQVFTCTAARDTGAYTLTVTEAVLSGSNPSCAGTCP